MSTSNNITFASPTNPPGGGASGTFDDGNVVPSATLEQSESESYTDWTRIVFMILWLIAFGLIILIIVSYVRESVRRHKGAVASSSATSQGRQTNRNNGDEENSIPVEIKPEAIAEEHEVEEVQELPQQPVEEEEKKQRWILPILSILIALSLSIATQTSCDYVSTSDIPLEDHYAFQEITISSFGLWSAAVYDGSYGSDDQCTSRYRNNGFTTDGKFIFSRSVAILASVLGCIALLTYVYYFIFAGKFDSPRFRTISLWLLGSATLTQGLVLVLLAADICSRDNASCDLGRGAISSITATIYWFVATLSVWCIRTVN